MNHLQYETSPYLLQHAHNPVDWFAWKEEALEKAKREDKPILVSIGYSTLCYRHYYICIQLYSNTKGRLVKNHNEIGR